MIRYNGWIIGAVMGSWCGGAISMAYHLGHPSDNIVEIWMALLGVSIQRLTYPLLLTQEMKAEIKQDEETTWK